MHILITCLNAQISFENGVPTIPFSVHCNTAGTSLERFSEVRVQITEYRVHA